MAYDTWGGSWGSSWGTSWTRSDTPPPTPSPSTGGGGGRIGSGFRQPTAAERKRYDAYVRRLVAKRDEADTEETRQLEIAWNRAHGIEAPDVVEMPAPVVELAKTIPRKVAKRGGTTSDMDRLIALVADTRAAITAEQQRIEKQRLDDDGAWIALLLSAWP